LMAEIAIRKMAPSDLDGVNEIDRRLFGNQRLPTWPYTFEVYWRQYHPDIRLVAEVDGTVAGFIVGSLVVEEHSSAVLNLRHSEGGPSRYSEVGYIDMIGIDPGRQNAGLGTALVNAFCAECKSLNVGVRGVATEHDSGLRQFLERMGFKARELIIFEREP
jgi:ribosomal protein S18 acetylase RimI-like enzyme